MDEAIAKRLQLAHSLARDMLGVGPDPRDPAAKWQTYLTVDPEKYAALLNALGVPKLVIEQKTEES